MTTQLPDPLVGVMNGRGTATATANGTLTKGSHFMLPDLESLRCFEKAAVTLNFRHAAAAVGLSPAAFGERIRRLEEQVGRRLFVRTTRQVSLTPAGDRLLVRARRALEEARRCLDATDGESKRPFELTIGTRFELGLSWLVPTLAPLGEARPERTLHVYFGDSEDLLPRVRSGGVDCAVSSARITMWYLRYELLHREDYVFVASPSVIAKKNVLRPEDVRHHRLLDLHPDLPLFRYFLDARPAGEPWDFEGIEYLGTIGAVRYRLLEGAGTAVLPRYFVEHELASGALRELMPKTALQHDHFRLIWHPYEDEIRQLAKELRGIPLTEHVRRAPQTQRIAARGS
jgi:LysR family transcriptional regulator, glycine cleavage system transcriptional activator